MLTNNGITCDNGVKARSQDILEKNQHDMYVYTDRLFVGLMIFQWIFGIVIALVVSPQTWVGTQSSVHIHIWAAIFLGAGIAIFPIGLGIFLPGRVFTRYVIAVGQMLYSALLIHLTGGRIETHFHVFGSLAFLAFYRDWKVLIPATIVVAADHFLRGVYWPQSVFGILTASPYRWIEHAAWVIFEDVFLIRSCLKSVEEMKRIATNTAELEFKNQELTYREKELVELNDNLDKKVSERTKNLQEANQQLQKTHEELKSAQIQLVQSEKLASIGQLAAGIAHEINNPMGFISSNLYVLGGYMTDYKAWGNMVEELKKTVAAKDIEKANAIREQLNKLEQEKNFDFLSKDIDSLLKESCVGTERIQKIVQELRIFTRNDHDRMELVQVDRIIDGILNIIHNELKYKAELKKNYGEVRPIRCNPQKMGQVFINLLVNAAQAIEGKGVIMIETYQNNGHVCVDVRDNGRGIEEKIIGKIFDAFFTTKPVGQGTGLGLSVSYEIVKKHGGDIKVHSRVGQGSTFTVMLPAAESDAKEQEVVS